MESNENNNTISIKSRLKLAYVLWKLKVKESKKDSGADANRTDRKLIFYVEDDDMYAKQLGFFIKNKFQKETDSMGFPVSELMLLELENGMRPDMIIMDHFLNSKYYDAELGLDALKKLRKKYPKIHFVLHSSQASLELAVEALNEGINDYVAKGDRAFERLEKIIFNLISPLPQST